MNFPSSCLLIFGFLIRSAISAVYSSCDFLKIEIFKFKLKAMRTSLKTNPRTLVQMLNSTLWNHESVIMEPPNIPSEIARNCSTYINLQI